MDDNVMLVVEVHGEWPAWLSECQDGLTASHIAAQEDEENVVHFANRVTESIEPDDQFCLGVIACNERIDDKAMAARRRMANCLAHELDKLGGGRVLLTISARACGRTRRALSDFASVLQAEHEESGTVISVRFGECPELQDEAKQVA